MEDREHHTRQEVPSDAGYARETFSSTSSRPSSVCTDRSVPSHASQLTRPCSVYSVRSAPFDPPYATDSHFTSSDRFEFSARRSIDHLAAGNDPQSQQTPLRTIDTALKKLAKSIHESGPTEAQAKLPKVDFQPLWEVSFKPPINVESLSWLDLNRFPSYARLYHLLNFESEAILHPQYKSDACLYWSALEVEFELYKQHQNCGRGQSWLCWLGTAFQKPPPLRLPHLLETIRGVLRTLVPADYVSCVDGWIDVDLLVPQIARGGCNFENLAEWIGCMLKLSCAEQRDFSVDKFIGRVRTGMARSEPSLLVSALELLFDIFEAMKLDILNAHICLQRPLLVADSVNCEQRYFESRISDGWDISPATAWYRQHISEGGDTLQLLARSVTKAITSPDGHLPETFEHDYEHVRTAQSSFSMICAEDSIVEECNQVFEADTHRAAKRSCIRQQNPHSEHATDQRDNCRTFTRCDSYNGHFSETKKLYEVSETSGTNCMKRKSNNKIGSRTRLRMAPSAHVEAARHRSALADQLEGLVKTEIWRVRHMSGLDLFNMYVSRLPRAPQNDVIPMRSGLYDNVTVSETGSMRTDVRTLGDRIPSSTIDKLCLLAQRIAHIAIIHYRVWHPIIIGNVQPGSAW